MDQKYLWEKVCTEHVHTLPIVIITRGGREREMEKEAETERQERQRETQRGYFSFYNSEMQIKRDYFLNVTQLTSSEARI